MFPNKFAPERAIMMLLMVGGIFISGKSVSQPLGTWAFNGTTAGTPGSYNTVSAADFSPAISSKGYSGSVYYGENGWPSGAINTASYFQFSLTPVGGQALNILSVVLSMRRSSTGSPAGSGPNSWSIRSSVDGYAADLSSGSITHNIGNYTITLPGGFNNLTATTTFRVYGYNATSTSGGLSRLVFDNIQVMGSNIILAERTTSITAKMQNNKVDIFVRLSSISPSDSYIIERSFDAQHFIPVYKINTPADIQSYNYNYQDILTERGAEKIYYRVAVKRGNDIVQYSNIAMIILSALKEEKLKLSVQGRRMIMDSDLKGSCTFLLVSTSGVCVCRKQISDAANKNIVDLPTLSGGIYHASLFNNTSRRSASVRITN